MKLDVDLTLLWSAVKQMGAQAQSIDLDNIWSEDEIAFDRELSSGGVEISLDDIEVTQGLLSARGRQVVLFIPDHGSGIDSVLENGSTGRKFHIAECETLESMRTRNRFERYKVIRNLDGQFPVYGESASGKTRKGHARLNVCQNCLKALNYKGADANGSGYRKGIVRSFDLQEFFSVYSSVFKVLPKQSIEDAEKGYTSDWESISIKMREQHGYTCQSCDVNLTTHKWLLHVHHINGEKSDNRDENLMVLCADCHRKEPYHNHMMVRRKDMLTITDLRNRQGIPQDRWLTVMKMADPAVHGLLDYRRKKGMSLPIVGYDLKNVNGEVIAKLELGWPDRKEGVCLGEEVKCKGWKIYNLQQALKAFR